MATTGRDLIETVRAYRSELAEVERYLEIIGDEFSAVYGDDIRVDAGYSGIIIDIGGTNKKRDSEEAVARLTEVRRRLFQALGSWSDEQRSIFGNLGGGVTIRWEPIDKSIHIVIQWSTFDPDLVPQDLLPSKDCTIKVNERTERSVTISCPVQEA